MEAFKHFYVKRKHTCKQRIQMEIQKYAPNICNASHANTSAQISTIPVLVLNYIYVIILTLGKQLLQAVC